MSQYNGHPDGNDAEEVPSVPPCAVQVASRAAQVLPLIDALRRAIAIVQGLKPECKDLWNCSQAQNEVSTVGVSTLAPLPSILGKKLVGILRIRPATNGADG